MRFIPSAVLILAVPQLQQWRRQFDMEMDCSVTGVFPTVNNLSRHGNLSPWAFRIIDHVDRILGIPSLLLLSSILRSPVFATLCITHHRITHNLQALGVIDNFTISATSSGKYTSTRIPAKSANLLYNCCSLSRKPHRFRSSNMASLFATPRHPFLQGTGLSLSASTSGGF